MATLGERLKIERQSRAISIEELSAATRITKKFINALEGDDFAAFPASLFIVGTIRTYAENLGLNADEFVAEYESQVGSDSNIKQEQQEQEQKRSGRKFPLSAVVGVIVLLLLGWLIVSGLGGKDEPAVGAAKVVEQKPVQKQPAATIDVSPKNIAVDVVAEPSPVIVEEPALKEDVAKHRKKVGELPKRRSLSAEEVQKLERKKNRSIYRYKFKISAEGRKVWILVVVDGKEIRDMFLKAGQTIYLNGNHSFLLTTGRADALRLSINGKKIAVKQSKRGVVKGWQVPIPM